MSTTVDGAQVRSRWFGQPEAVLVVVLGLVAVQGWVSRVLDDPALRTWVAMFVAIVVQSLPFLVLGVVLAALISTLLSDRLLRAVLPRNPALAVPIAGVAGVALVGCECASVPIAGSVVRRGVAPAAALTFLLAAPAVNPVVVVSTLVAFPGAPEMAVARFAASLLTAVAVGWIWVALGKRVPPLLDRRRGHRHDQVRSVGAFLATVQHDLVQSAGYVVLGAMIAAATNTFLPRAWVEGVGRHVVLGVVVMAVFAFVVALCSQTDAFVAASLTAVSPTARLVFLVVGPAMDVKLAALEAGVFGRHFASVFAPLVVVVATLVAVLLGWWVL